MLIERGVIWLHPPARHWGWVRVRREFTRNDLDMSPFAFSGCQVVAYTYGEVMTHTGQKTSPRRRKIVRIAYRDVMSEPEGFGPPPTDAVRNFDPCTRERHPSECQLVYPNPAQIADSIRWHDVFQRYWLTSLFAKPEPKEVLDYVFAGESDIVWLLPQFKRAHFLYEMTMRVPVIGNVHPDYHEGVTIVAFSRGENCLNSCRVWALPTSMTGLEKPEPLPGWEIVRPSSIQAGKPSKPPHRFHLPTTKRFRESLGN